MKSQFCRQGTRTVCRCPIPDFEDRKSKFENPGPPGFTLLEMMVVISIIMALAATLVTAGVFAHRLTMVKATEGIINTLKLAVHSYSSDYNGEFPPSYETVAGDDTMVGSGKCGIQAVCTYIFSNPDFALAVSKGKPDYYARAKDFRNDSVVYNTGDDSVNYITDTWGTPLFYYRPGGPGRNPDSFDLFSAGPDLRTTTEIFDRSGAPTYDYSLDPPWHTVWTGTEWVMQQLANGTGSPAELSPPLPDPVDTASPERLQFTFDDIGNFQSFRTDT